MKHKLLTGSLSFTVGMGFSALPAVAQQSPASTEVKPNVGTVVKRIKLYNELIANAI